MSVFVTNGLNLFLVEKNEEYSWHNIQKTDFKTFDNACKVLEEISEHGQYMNEDLVIEY